jgi:peptidoglycan-associated lipoprotein
VKNFKWSWMVVIIFIMALGTGCGKKTVRSEAVPYTAAEAGKGAEAKPEMKEEAKLEPISPEKAAEQKKIQEETLREQAMREKALREKAMAEEAARREALARQAALKGMKLEPIHFDFDQAVILDSQRQTMINNSEWLKAHPQAKIRIEGHCDERGTSEYNLALGQKRAEAAKRFLEGLGIPALRMSTVSYGEERPVAEGHNEEAWAKNRRAEFVLVP